MASSIISTPAAQRIPDRRHAEAPLTLEETAPRVLSFVDQLGLWGNLGVSLLGPVGAIYVLQPPTGPRLSLLAAIVAVVVGTVLGTGLLAVATIPGAQTGRPSMVLLRGLFGRTVSYAPTILNIIALVGWSVFEIVVISSAAQQLLGAHGLRWPYVLAAGVLTTVMAIRPLGAVRVLRKYAVAAVLVATIYLFVQLLRHPLPPLTQGSWTGFWAGADVAVAVAVSWVSLASDYSRHSRTVAARGSRVLPRLHDHPDRLLHPRPDCPGHRRAGRGHPAARHVRHVHRPAPRVARLRGADPAGTRPVLR